MKHEGRGSSIAAPEPPGGEVAEALGGRGHGWREVRRQGVYLALTLLVMALVALGLGALAVSLQADRDEARSADLVLVVAPAAPPAQLADDAFELYRRGYVATMVLVGEGKAGLKAQLLERGVPEARLLSDESDLSTTADLRRRAQEALAGGATSALVVSAPAETLRALKVVRDQGLRAYGSPSPAGGIDPLSLPGASARYWRYVLLGL